MSNVRTEHFELMFPRLDCDSTIPGYFGSKQNILWLLFENVPRNKTGTCYNKVLLEKYKTEQNIFGHLVGNILFCIVRTEQNRTIFFGRNVLTERSLTS